MLADFRQAHFKAAVQQAIGILNSHDARQLVLLRQLQIAHHAPGRFVRHADIADFAGAHLLGQRFQRLQQRDGNRGLAVLIAQLAEIVSLALRPVQLIKIEVVGIQALQAGVQRVADIFAVQRLVRANRGVCAARRTRDLAGEDHFIAAAARLQPAADILFG